MIVISSLEDFHRALAALVDSWCDRRCLSALRCILHGYPLTSGLTDDWANLLKAMGDVRALAHEDITEEESKALGQLIVFVQRIVYRS